MYFPAAVLEVSLMYRIYLYFRCYWHAPNECFVFH